MEKLPSEDQLDYLVKIEEVKAVQNNKYEAEKGVRAPIHIILGPTGLTIN